MDHAWSLAKALQPGAMTKKNKKILAGSLFAFSSFRVRTDGIMAFALSATLSVAYSTPRPDMLFTSSRPLSPAPLPEFRRTDADFLEGVHSEPSQPLTQRVLERGMPHRARTPNEQTSRAPTARMSQRSSAPRQACYSHV